MKKLTQFLAVVLALAFTSTTLAATSPVGSTPGSFAVSPSGAATYSIPIQIPPGVGGMQPGLALSYNSQGGNGIAGVGWDIAGLSAITRCGATIDRDGSKGGVDLTPSDKFCLDGQRLIDIGASPAAICSGGREFRTEIESFSKVVSCGTTGNGTTSFTVTSKNGMTTECGVGNGAQQFALGNATVLNWHVSKIKDALGNSMQFLYSGDGVNLTTSSYGSGEHYLRRVDYTFNSSGGAIGGVTRSVQFNYGARGDVETRYVGGGVVKEQLGSDTN